MSENAAIFEGEGSGAWSSAARLHGCDRGKRAGRLGLRVVLTKYSGLDELYLALASSVVEAGELEKALSGLASVAAVDASELRPGRRLLADFRERGLGFCRADVLASKDDEAQLLCVDSGAVVAAPARQLFPLPDELAQRPPLTRRFRMHGWNEEELGVPCPEALEEFVQAFCKVDRLENVVLTVDLMGTGKDGVMAVNVFREGAISGDSIELAAELLTAGLVVPKGTPPPMSEPSTPGKGGPEPLRTQVAPNPLTPNGYPAQMSQMHPLRPVFPFSQRRLFVGSLLPGTTDAALYEYFSRFGRLRDWHIVRDGRTGDPRFAFVTFGNLDAAAAALAQRPHIIGEHKIFVRPAEIRSDFDVADEEEEVDAGPVKQMFIDHVGNLGEMDIRNYFGRFGDVTRCNKPADRNFAFLDFKRPEMVEAALADGHGHLVSGVLLKARKAQEKNREWETDDCDYEDLPWYERGLSGPDGRGPMDGADAPTPASSSVSSVAVGAYTSVFGLPPALFQPPFGPMFGFGRREPRPSFVPSHRY